MGDTPKATPATIITNALEGNSNGYYHQRSHTTERKRTKRRCAPISDGQGVGDIPKRHQRPSSPTPTKATPATITSPHTTERKRTKSLRTISDGQSVDSANSAQRR